jgi:hypothetical protein
MRSVAVMYSLEKRRPLNILRRSCPTMFARRSRGATQWTTRP